MEEVIQSTGAVSNLLNEHGPGITITAIIIILFIGLLLYIINSHKRMINKLLEEQQEKEEKNDKLLEQLIAQTNQTSVKDIIKSELNNEKRSHQNIISVYINSNTAFHSSAIDVVEKIKCSRIAIYLFHNGNSTPFGYPFAKMTCVYEYTIKNTHSTIRGQAHNDLPLYVFSDLVNSLATTGEYIIEDCKKELEYKNSQLSYFLNGEPMGSLYAMTINDDNDIPSAFTILEFKEIQNFNDNEFLTLIRTSLHDMNTSIRHIIINDSFVDRYEHNNNENEEEESEGE